MTRRESILNQVFTTVKTISLVNSANIYRSRINPFNTAKLPAVSIEPVIENFNNDVLVRLDSEFIFKVTVYGRSNNPDSDIDSIINEIHSKISSDPVLINMITNLTLISIDWEFFDGDKTSVISNITYKSTYRTDTNNLSA